MKAIQLTFNFKKRRKAMARKKENKGKQTIRIDEKTWIEVDANKCPIEARKEWMRNRNMCINVNVDRSNIGKMIQKPNVNK